VAVAGLPTIMSSTTGQSLCSKVLTHAQKHPKKPVEVVALSLGWLHDMQQVRYAVQANSAFFVTVKALGGEKSSPKYTMYPDERV